MACNGSDVVSFSKRERQILALRHEGKPYKIIATELGISEHHVSAKVGEIARFVARVGSCELMHWLNQHPEWREGEVRVPHVPVKAPRFGG